MTSVTVAERRSRKTYRVNPEQVQQQAYEDALVADENRHAIAQAVAISGLFGAVAALASAGVARLRRMSRIW